MGNSHSQRWSRPSGGPRNRPLHPCRPPKPTAESQTTAPAPAARHARKKPINATDAGRCRPQVAPRPQDADLLADTEPLLREGAPGRRAQKICTNIYKKRAVGLPPARRPVEEEEGALEEAVSLFSTTEEGASAEGAARAVAWAAGTSVIIRSRRGGPGQE